VSALVIDVASVSVTVLLVVSTDTPVTETLPVPPFLLTLKSPAAGVLFAMPTPASA
jgi:hypothetical protein